MKVLITDANQRSSLAATRSLGRKGIHVTAADETETSLSSKSRYCADYFTYPSPYVHPQEFIESIKTEIVKRKINIVFPMTDVSTYMILKEKKSLENYVNIPSPDFETFDLISDKIKLLQLAKKFNIPFPKTRLVKNAKELQAALPHLEFPVVIKPARSKMQVDGKWIHAAIRYAANVNELEKIVEQNIYYGTKVLIQHRIVGSGLGIFTLFNHGNPIVFFAHKRLREKPPSGGVSVLRESISVDPQLQKFTTHLLSNVNWHGVAMVEFKHDEQTQTPYLMEVNGRFWGSLQLAIDAGLDFPYLLYQMALGNQPDELSTYKVGIRSRWLLGDLDQLYMRLFKSGLYLPPHYPSRLKCILDFLRFYEKNTKVEVESFADPLPSLYEVRQYLKELLR